MAIPTTINLQTFEDFRQEVIKACTIYPLEPESLEFEATFINLVQNTVGDEVFKSALSEAEKNSSGLSERDKHNDRLLYLLDAVWAYLQQHPEQELSPGQLSAMLVSAYEHHKAEIAATEKSTDTKIKLDQIIKLAQRAHVSNTQEFAEQLTVSVLHPDGNVSDTILSTQQSLNFQSSAHVAEIINNKEHTPEKKTRLIQEFLQENQAPQSQAASAAQQIVEYPATTPDLFTPRIAMQVINKSLATTATNTPPQSHPITELHPITEVVDAFTPVIPFSLQPHVVEIFNTYKADTTTTSDETLAKATLADILEVDEDTKRALIDQAQSVAEREDTTTPVITQKTADEITDTLATAAAADKELDTTTPEIAKIVMDEGGKTQTEATNLANQIVTQVAKQSSDDVSDQKISDFLSQPTATNTTVDPQLEEQLNDTISAQPSARSKSIAAASVLASVYGLEKATEIVSQIDFSSPSPVSNIEEIASRYTPTTNPQITPLITNPTEAADLVSQITKSGNQTEAIAQVSTYLNQRGFSDPQNIVATKYVDAVTTLFNEGGSNEQAQTIVQGLPLGKSNQNPSQVVEIRPLINSSIEATQIASILSAGGSVHENLTTHFSKTLPSDQAEQASLLVEYHTASVAKSGQTSQLLETIQSTPATRIDTYPTNAPSRAAVAITAAALATNADLPTAKKFVEFAAANPNATQDAYVSFAKNQLGLDDKSASQIAAATLTAINTAPTSTTDQTTIASIISAKGVINSSILPTAQKQEIIADIDKTIPTGQFTSDTFNQILTKNQIDTNQTADLVTKQSSATLSTVVANTNNAPEYLKEIDLHQKEWGLNPVQADAVKTRYVAAIATAQSPEQIRPLLNQIPGLNSDQTTAILTSIEKTKSQIASSFTPENLNQTLTGITTNPALNLTQPQQQAANKIIASNIITGGSTEDIRRELGQIPNLSPEKITQIATSASDVLKNQSQPFVAPTKLGLVLDNIDLKRSDVGTTIAQTQAVKKIVAGNISSNTSLAELRRDLNQVSDLTPDQADKIVSQVDGTMRLLSGSTNNQVESTFAQFDAKKTQLGFTQAQAEATKSIMAGAILTNKPLETVEKELNQIPGLDTKKVAAAINVVTQNATQYQTPIVSQLSTSTGVSLADRSLLATTAAASAAKIDISAPIAKSVAGIVTNTQLSNDQKISQIASSVNVSQAAAQELLTNTQLILTPVPKTTQNIVSLVANRNNINLTNEDRTQIANLLQNPTDKSAAEIKSILVRYSDKSEVITNSLNSAYDSAIRLPAFSKKTTSKIAEAVNTIRKTTPDISTQKASIAKEISKITGVSSEGGTKIAEQIITSLPPRTPITRQRLAGLVQQAAFPDRPGLTSQSIKKFTPEQRLTFIFQNELKKSGVTPAVAKQLAQNSGELKFLLDSQLNKAEHRGITLDFLNRNGIDISKISPRTQQIVSSVVPRLANPEMSPASLASLLQGYQKMSPASQKAMQNLFQGKNYDVALQQFLGKDIALAFQKEGLNLALPAMAAAAYQTDLNIFGKNTTESYHFRNTLDMSLSYLQQKTPQGSVLSQKIIEFRNRLPQTNTDGLERLLNFKNPLNNPKILMDTFTGKARGFFNYVTNPNSTANNIRWFETVRLAFSQRDLRIVPETLLKNFGSFSRQFRLLTTSTSLRQRAIISGQNSKVFRAGYARVLKSQAARRISASLGKTAAGRAVKAVAGKVLGRVLGAAAAGSTLGPVGTAVATAVGVVIEVGKALWNPIKKGAKYIGAAILGVFGGSTMTLGSAVGATAGFAVAGPAGAVVGAGVGGAAGGAVQVATNSTSSFLQTVGATTGTAIAAITTFTVSNTGLPLAISALIMPIVIAFFLFIINAGGYVIPNSGTLTSSGDIVNPIGGGILPDDPSGDTPRCWPYSQEDLAKTTVYQGPWGKSGCANCSHDTYREQAVDLPTGNARFAVYATHNGTVTNRDTGDAGYGKHIILTGTAGISTIYAHLFASTVPDGTRVGRGTLIGYTDDTGNSTGPHLHYEIIPNTNDFDLYVPPYTVGETPTGCSAHDNLITQPSCSTADLQSYGTSVEGRDLNYFKIGTGSTKRAIIGGIHGGYEYNGVDLANRVLDYVCDDPSKVPSNITLYIIPNANPDGYAKAKDINGRPNARGVDLNRNWNYHNNWRPWSHRSINGCTLPASGGAAPFSEPETSALRNLISSQGISATIFYHSQYSGGGIFYGGYQCEANSYELAHTLSSGTYRVVDAFSQFALRGVSSDYLSASGISSVEIELPERASFDWATNQKIVDLFLGWNGSSGPACRNITEQYCEVTPP